MTPGRLFSPRSSPELSAGSGRSRRRLATPGPFALAGSLALASSLALAGPLALANAAIDAAASAAPAARSSIAERYLATLDLLASGNTEAALEHHLAAEAAAVPTGEKEEIESLEDRQMAIARRLGSTSSESLVPLVQLHEAAYLAHLETRHLQLAVRSRRFAAELVELYVTLSRRPDAERVGSNLLTSLGGYLQQSTMDSAAIRLYERALELDPDSATARLNLVTLYERQGRYMRTLPHLEAMLDHADRYSEDRRREASLRLGVNLLRLDRVDEGLEQLESLRGESREDWILSLAYQELARHASLVGDDARARRLAIEAVERLPDDASLAVLAAFLDDRTGGRPTTTDLRGTFQATAAAASPSPRALYASSSGVALTELRQSNAADSQRRLAPLAEALSRRATRERSQR